MPKPKPSPAKPVGASPTRSIFNELIAKLDFSEEQVAASLLNQPTLLLKASHYRVQKLRNRMQAEADYDKASAECALRVRAQSEGKITEAYIKETVATDADVLLAQRKYNETKAAEEWAKLLIESYQMRGSMLKALVQLLGAAAASESGFLRAEMERLGMGKLADKVRARFEED